MEITKYQTEIAGKKLEVEFSNLAAKANGSVWVRYGGTVVFATATQAREPRTGINFFPLSVDYEEKFYAAGQILGSRFLRREGRPSENAVLTGRLIDRTLRPLFNQKMRNEIHVVVMALSIDGENDPDIPAIMAASLAVATSDIPWDGPVSPLRIGINEEDGRVLFNPTNAEREKSLLDLVACYKAGKINMIEAGAKEVPEEKALEAIQKAMSEFEKIEQFQKETVAKAGKTKIKIPAAEEIEGLRPLFEKHFRQRLEDYVYAPKKPAGDAAIGDLKKEWLQTTKKQFGESSLKEADDLYEETIYQTVRKNILDLPAGEEKRPDGRKLNELRSLFARAGVLERTHGSGIFFRGETHILSVATLGAPGDVLIIEGMEIQTKKRFMHHYNFPPFSSGETGRMGSPGRREIGHGALAERALEAVIPPTETFPYTIRLVSETMSSNGSTSMGSVCASSLALMDAGVPIKEPVAGIAMGLIMENENKFKVLTDLQGPEDHHGDMDFKAAGTKNGITAIQMDVKVEGVTVEILKQTLADAKIARQKIMEVMLKAIARPKDKLSPFAPRIMTLSINHEKIRDVIGPGGKTINKITEITGAEIDIEQTGLVFITAKDESSAQKAFDLVKNLTKEFEIGEELTGKVSRIFEFGAMVEIGPKQEGLVHISELAPFRVNKVRDLVKIGDEVPVKIVGIDELGRINLSIKQSSKGKEMYNGKNGRES